MTDEELNNRKSDFLDYKVKATLSGTSHKLKENVKERKLTRKYRRPNEKEVKMDEEARMNKEMVK